jgi:hypothetical protein
MFFLRVVKMKRVWICVREGPWRSPGTNRPNDNSVPPAACIGRSFGPTKVRKVSRIQFNDRDIFPWCSESSISSNLKSFKKATQESFNKYYGKIVQ